MKKIVIATVLLLIMICFSSCNAEERFTISGQEDFISQKSETYSDFDFQLYYSKASNTGGVQISSDDINYTNIMDIFIDTLNFVFKEGKTQDSQLISDLSLITVSIDGSDGQYIFYGEPVSYDDIFMGYTQWMLSIPEEIRDGRATISFRWRDGNFYCGDEIFVIENYITIQDNLPNS